MSIVSVAKTGSTPAVEKDLVSSNTANNREISRVSVAQPSTITPSNATTSSVFASSSANASANASANLSSNKRAADSSETAPNEASLAKENEFIASIREESEARRQEKVKEEQEEALAKAKADIVALNQKQIALRFDTAKKFNDAHIVNVVDTKSNEVIRQIPSDEMLRVAKTINEYKERIAHDEMVSDPKLKAQGVDTSNSNESLRGVMLDDIA